MGINRRGTFDAVAMEMTTLVNCDAHAALGTQTFSVDGKLYSATDCRFTAPSDLSSTALTVPFAPAQASTFAGLQIFYAIMVMGTHVYI